MPRSSGLLATIPAFSGSWPRPLWRGLGSLAELGIRQRPTAPKLYRQRRRKAGSSRGGIVVNLADTAGNEVGSVKIDDADAELLQKAAAASELKLTELLHFIVLRQLEAFFPPEVEGLYRVSDNAIHEISSGFESAQQHVEALWAVALALVERVDKERSLVSPADYCAAISELKVLSSLIEDLAGSARVEVADANTHWQIAGRPALLEQHVAPVSIPSTRVAA